MILMFLSAERETVASWEKELRVAEYDFDSGKTVEVSSQILFENSAKDTPLAEAEYTTCEVAFLADAPAGKKTAYLLFFGNPNAAKPDYASELVSIKNASGEKVMENPYYQIALHKESGQINDFLSKTFGMGAKNGCGGDKCRLHHTRGCWAKGRDWSHT